VKVYSTLSGRKEEFVPPNSEVKMYVCGVTPYSDAHIGHAMSQVIFDVIHRYLLFREYKVKYVQNITDIDDKIIDRANQTGVSTEEIDKILEVIQGLIDKEYAYPTHGSVYFRIRNVPDYGKLSHRDLESMMPAESGVGSDDKENSLDFVLWKAAKPGEPSWESPWGKGRPGWHIECSAMSLKYLGGTIDIHGGGQDLIFPHHENEITQSESFTGVKPFARHWLHNGMVQLGGEKMSKSVGNLITVKEILQRYSPDAIRIFILNCHYRSPLTYSEGALEASEKAAARLRHTAMAASGDGDKEVDSESYRLRFIKAMDDDFNTAQALASLFDLAREVNRLRDEGYNIDRGRATLTELGDILGLTFKTAEKASLDIEPLRMLLIFINEQLLKAELSGLAVEQLPDDVDSLMEMVTESRSTLRQAKQWQASDEIRDNLAELNIILEDTAQGTVWKQKR
jgi:cysteinyl-tRNA synthetase